MDSSLANLKSQCPLVLGLCAQFFGSRAALPGWPLVLHKEMQGGQVWGEELEVKPIGIRG